MAKQKVFCIGFHKTGTTSLTKALESLGYRIYDNKIDLLSNLVVNNDIEQLLLLAEQYDGVQDNPWPLIYKELDERFPNAKFILSTRSTEKWIKSVVNHFGENTTQMRSWIYGVGDPSGNEEVYTARYERHYKEVRAHFKERPDDMLEVSLESGDSWEKLCAFLNEPIPNVPFPHSNKGKYRRQSSKRSIFGLFKSKK